MNKLIFTVTAFVIFMVFVLPGILALPVKFIPFNDQPGYDVDHRRDVGGTNTVSQEFISQEDRLTAVAMTIGNPNLKNKKKVSFALYENEKKIRTSELSGLNIPDGNFTKFIFEPIPDSKNKKYIFTLDSKEAGSEEILYVYFTEKTPDWVLDMSYQGKKFEEGKLSFVTFHTPKSKLSLILNVYENWIRRVFGK